MDHLGSKGLTDKNELSLNQYKSQKDKRVLSPSLSSLLDLS